MKAFDWHFILDSNPFANPYTSYAAPVPQQQQSVYPSAPQPTYAPAPAGPFGGYGAPNSTHIPAISHMSLIFHLVAPVQPAPAYSPYGAAPTGPGQSGDPFSAPQPQRYNLNDPKNYIAPKPEPVIDLDPFAMNKMKAPVVSKPSAPDAFATQQSAPSQPFGGPAYQQMPATADPFAVAQAGPGQSFGSSPQQQPAFDPFSPSRPVQPAPPITSSFTQQSFNAPAPQVPVAHDPFVFKPAPITNQQPASDLFAFNAPQQQPVAHVHVPPPHHSGSPFGVPPQQPITVSSNPSDPFGFSLQAPPPPADSSFGQASSQSFQLPHNGFGVQAPPVTAQDPFRAGPPAPSSQLPAAADPFGAAPVTQTADPFFTGSAASHPPVQTAPGDSFGFSQPAEADPFAANSSASQGNFGAFGGDPFNSAPATSTAPSTGGFGDDFGVTWDAPVATSKTAVDEDVMSKFRATYNLPKSDDNFDSPASSPQAVPTSGFKIAEIKKPGNVGAVIVREGKVMTRLSTV